MSENERLKILKLLEDGKITADEAARLLEALGEGELRRRHRMIGLDLNLFKIPDMVFKAMHKGRFKGHMNFAEAFAEESCEVKTEFPRKKRVVFKGVAGDISLLGSVGDKILVEKEGLGQIFEHDEELGINAISGDVRIQLPKQTEVKLTGVSGDITFTGLENKIEVFSVSGDVKGTEMKGDFIASVASADIMLEVLEVKNLEIKSRSGEIELRLDSDIEAEIEVFTRHGRVECELELDTKEKQENLVKGVYRSKKGRIKIDSYDGNIYLKKLNK